MKKAKLAFTAKELTLLGNALAVAHSIEHDADTAFALALIAFLSQRAPCEEIVALAKRIHAAAHALTEGDVLAVTVVPVNIETIHEGSQNDPLTS